MAYTELEEMWRSFCEMNVLAYTDESEDLFITLRKRKVRIGTMDLRIACIALTTNSTVLTRNLRDFRQVPGLNAEDWTA